MDSRLRRSERGTTPVVSKILAIGIALLYIGGMTTLLYGSVVPGYQTAAGDELADRTLATAASEIEASIPDVGGDVGRERSISLPARIDDERYHLDLSGGTLTLDHPDRQIEAETHLSVPPTVTIEESTWNSGDELLVRVAGPPENRTVWIES